MAEQKPLNKGAKDLKKKLEKSRVKNANVRARKGAKIGSGTITERVKGAAKATAEKRGLPAIRKENLPEIQKRGLPAVRKENLPAIRKGNLPAVKGGSAPRGFASGAGGIGGSVARGLFRGIGGPAVMLASMTTPTGDGQEDKPSGPLMKGGRQAGYKYKDEAPVPVRKAAGTYTKPYDKPEKPPIPKAKPQSQPKTKSFKAPSKAPSKAPERKAEAPKRPSFKGNWVGAAPTAMQARAGKKVSRPNFLSLIRGK